MGAPRDPVWLHVVPGSKHKHVKCNFCGKEMFSNPTWLKRHIVGDKCTPPRNVKITLLQRLLGSGKKGADDKYAAELASMQTDDNPSAKRTRPSSGAASTASACSAGGPRTLDGFVRVMSSKESEAIDGKVAMLIYRRAMPLSTTTSPEFLYVVRALNPAYCPPSRYSLSGPLLSKEYLELSRIVDMFVRRSVADGDLVIGGDGWTDRLNNCIYNLLFFTPEPVYEETKVWGESRHSAVKTADFFTEHIEKLGPRNVCAFISDTENKMKAVWDLLKERYPWLLIIPCGGHCMDLLHGDISKHAYVARALAFCNSMTQYWKMHSFPKKVLERCQMAEYKKTIELQRPGSTRWSSQVTAASV